MYDFTVIWEYFYYTNNTRDAFKYIDIDDIWFSLKNKIVSKIRTVSINFSQYTYSNRPPNPLGKKQFQAFYYKNQENRWKNKNIFFSPSQFTSWQK